MRGRRLFCGNNKGTLYLLNFTDGSIIDELKVHIVTVNPVNTPYQCYPLYNTC